LLRIDESTQTGTVGDGLASSSAQQKGGGPGPGPALPGSAACQASGRQTPGSTCEIIVTLGLGVANAFGIVLTGSAFSICRPPTIYLIAASRYIRRALALISKHAEGPGESQTGTKA